LEAADVARTAIDGGFDCNAWTERTTTGRMNSRWVVNPAGSYNPNLSQTPSVIPAYRLEYAMMPEPVPSDLGSVSYFSFLPSFRKQFRIDWVLER
jgi:hypothetical protein